MHDRVLLALTVLWCFTAPVSLVIHLFVVCRRLYAAGAKFPTGLIPWRIYWDMGRYKELCRAQGDSLSAYYIFLLLLQFNIGLGLYLLLAHIHYRTEPRGY